LAVIWCMFRSLRGVSMVLHLGLAPLCATPWVLAPSVAGETSYYVDANQGSDSYSGRLAEPDANQTDGPLRTIKTAYDRLLPGDTLYIKKGVYRETITLHKSASQSSPIVIQAFPGDEGQVVINGAARIEDWKACSSQASCGGNPNWEKIYYAEVGLEIRQLFQEGSRLKLSRYPDRLWRYPTSADPNDPNRVFMDASLLKDGFYTGSTCNVRTAAWHLDQIVVSVYSADKGKVSLASPTRYGMSTDTGYYFTNLVSEINEAGEWAFDGQQGRVYLWPMAGSPENVEATVRDAGIDTTPGCSYHTISGLAVRYAANGIRICGAHHVIVKDNTIDYSYYVGILDSNAADSMITANTIRYTGFMGIQQDGLCTNGLIQGNTVYATGAEQLGDDLVYGNALGMAINGSCTRVLNNRIDRSGYDGLYAGRGDTSGREIGYNYITNSCLALADGAGIYTDGRSSSSEPDTFHHNIVADVWGWRGGWARYEASDTGSTQSGRGEAYGIYVDEQGNNRIFEYNTVLHCGTAGMFFHWAQDNRLSHNTLYGNAKCQILFVGRQDPRFTLRDNVTQGNLLIATTPDQKTLQVNLDTNDVRFGECDQNRFYNPQNQRHIRVCQDRGGDPCVSYSLAEWREVSGQDAHSIDLSPSEGQGGGLALSVIFANPSMGTLEVDLADQDYLDVEDKLVKGKVSLGSFESIVLFPCEAGNGD